MIIPKQTNFYQIEALYANDGQVGLEQSIRDFFNRPDYELGFSQDFNNDELHSYDLSTPEKISELLGDQWNRPELDLWLQGEKNIFPSWRILLAYMIDRGQYPFGHYLLSYSW